jgi:hypothetical protein
MTDILNTVDKSIQNNKPVYIHCWGGVGRTGITVGCYFIRRGFSADDALLRVANLFSTRPPSYFQVTSPETPEQFDFVRNWWDEIPSAKHPANQNTAKDELDTRVTSSKPYGLATFAIISLTRRAWIVLTVCLKWAAAQALFCANSSRPPRFMVWTLNLLR